MKIVSLDVHTEASQLLAVNEDGEVVLEMKLATEPELLRTVIAGIPGPKRVVFEEGPLSGMLMDALSEVADEVISCDPTQNPTIARDENSNDERDAAHLATLAQLGQVHPVYVPPEPYRTWRSLLVHDRRLERWTASTKNAIKALCRRQGIRYRGQRIYEAAGRGWVAGEIESTLLRWQVGSQYRQLDLFQQERQRLLARLRREMKPRPVVSRLCTVPGVGFLTAATLLAWVVDPGRFKSRSALSAYAGLGLGQGVTAWKPIGRAKASKRGQRQLKRILFLAAHAASRSHSALGRRYQAHRDAGWEQSKAIRDLARTLLRTVCALWKTHKEYDDEQVTVPAGP
jgi:transposase